MRHMPKLLTLLAKATGPDRGLDIAIAQATPVDGWRVDDTGHVECYADMGGGDGPGWFPSGQEVPHYTAHLDDAARLIPKDLYWMMGYGKTREAEPLGACALMKPGDVDDPVAQGEAATVPLAICIAALTYRAASSTPN